MNCEDIKLMLLEYVMEEVSGNDRTEIAFHLESCAECSEEAGKLRQTLEAMAQGAAFEDIPQKIRIVAEPASWWIAFWRHPARLALAASGLACVAIAMLALASATIQYQNGNFEVAFGAAAPSIQSLSNQSPAAASLPSIASLAPAVTQTLSREDVVRLIAEAVAASEARQSAGAVRIVNAAAQQVESNRITARDRDRRELAESFRYFQASQVNMWKQQVENQQVMSALVERTGIESWPRP